MRSIMVNYDYLFDKEDESFVSGGNGNGFDPEKICRKAAWIAEYFEMPFKGDESDIDTLEGILRGLHVDYMNGRLEGEKIINAEITFGVYLGQFILDHCLGKYGFEWDLSDGVPCISKGKENKVTPISRVHRHIVDGNKDDDVRGLYGVVKQLSEQIFKSQDESANS